MLSSPRRMHVIGMLQCCVLRQYLDASLMATSHSPWHHSIEEQASEGYYCTGRTSFHWATPSQLVRKADGPNSS